MENNYFNMTRIKEEMKTELTEHILPFWMQLKDDKYGGFYGYMSSSLVLDRESDKGGILNSRILWTFSNAYLLINDRKLLEYARHAYEFLINSMYDKERGGIYWSVNYRGEPSDTIKHSYNIAFAIYALSSYYDASGDENALALAKELFNVEENIFRDKYGYVEALTVDFKPQSNEHLSENGIIAERTMNTTLHIFEAYTELYRVSGFEPAREAMLWVLDIFRNQIYNRKLHRLEVFFDERFNSLIDLHSYGHDIEAAWLLERGIEILKDRHLQDDFFPIFEDLENQIIGIAYDGTSISAECEKGIVLTNRIWWVQCEAIIGFYNAYMKRPTRIDFLEAVNNIWEFIKKYFIDSREGGEWINERFYDAEMTVNQKEPVLSPWKCPYHNSRMCLEMIRRII